MRMSAVLPAETTSAWAGLRRAAPALALGLVLLGTAFHREAGAAVATWAASTAYNHGFLVLPIALWLIWDRRAALAGAQPRLAPLVLLAVLPLGLAWFAAERLGIMEGRQLAAMGFVEVLLLAVLGWRFYWLLALPFLYLFFLVPFGGFLVPMLQDFTAAFINHGLDLIGIPHFSNGFTIEIPEGSFYIAEACAGLRFLIASIAFGVLYAGVMYESPWRRAAFIVASIVAPIIANGLRALGIVSLARQCVEIGRRYHKSVSVTASVGGFVPKPQTPFQWFGQNTVEELTRKVRILREAARTVRGLTVRWHDPEATVAEGIVSRGDRRTGAVLEEVWRQGGTFQEWSEHFDLGRWEEALGAEGLSIEEECYRERGEDEPLPWDHISAGLHRDFLWGEWQDALAEVAVEDCRWTPCYDCGACTGFGLEHIVASPVPPAGGSQGTGQDLDGGSRVPVRFVAGAR